LTTVFEAANHPAYRELVEPGRDRSVECRCSGQAGSAPGP
jgi:hypothetical protein